MTIYRLNPDMQITEVALECAPDSYLESLSNGVLVCDAVFVYGRDRGKLEELADLLQAMRCAA